MTMLRTNKTVTQAKSGFLSGKINVSLLILFILCALAGGIQAAFAQTNYTWNGATSTAWGTSTNWTPNGVPTSADNVTIVATSNNPVLSANTTVNSLTMTSGTLQLGGHDMTVTGSGTFNGGTLQNGKLAMTAGTAYFGGATMDCTVDVDADITGIYNTAFKKKATLYVRKNVSVYAGGNVFSDTTFIERPIANYFRMGHNAPDTFLAPVIFSNYGYFYLAYNTADTYFADEVTFDNHATATNRGFYIGASASSSIRFDGDIILNTDSTTMGYINFYLGTNEHNGRLLTGSGGYHGGALTLKAYTQVGSDAVDLSAMDYSSTLKLVSGLTLKGDLIGPSVNTTLQGGCTFKGTVSLPNLYSWGGCRFEKKATITAGRTNATMYTGNNMFLDSAIISRPANYLKMGHNVPDTFLAPVTFNLTGAWTDIYLADNTAGNYFAGDVTLNNRAASTNRGFYIGPGTSSGTHFAGDIILNADSTAGYISFYRGSNVHDGILRIGAEGYHSRTLTLDHYTQTGTGTIDLSAMDNGAALSVQSGADITADLVFAGGGTATLSGATFRGDADITSANLPVSNCDFYGTTSLKKTGSANNLNKGNMFRGATTIENISNNYVYWGYNTPDTFLNALTLINRGNSTLWMNYKSTGQYGGDITLDGDSLKVIRFGSSTAGRVAVFNGSTDQTLNVLNPNLNVQAYRLEVNKSGGRLKVNSDVAVSYELKLTDGIIEMQNAATLTLNDGVAPTATNASYVEGKVKKIGNDAFTFPVGRNGLYRPIGISAPSNTGDAFEAEYFESNSDWVNSHTSKDSTLNYLSTNEYWTLTREVGTSTPLVTLSWDTLTSCKMDTPLTSIHIAGWSASAAKWKDFGNGGTTGTADVGTVSSVGGVSDFEMFVLGNDNVSDCRIIDFRWTPNPPNIDEMMSLLNDSWGFNDQIQFEWDIRNYEPQDYSDPDSVTSNAIYRTYLTDTLNIRIFNDDTLDVLLKAFDSSGNLMDSISKKIAVTPGFIYVYCDSYITDCNYIINGNFGQKSDTVVSGPGQINLAAAWNKIDDLEFPCISLGDYMELRSTDYFSDDCIPSGVYVNSIPDNTYTINGVESHSQEETVNSGYGGIYAYNNDNISGGGVSNYREYLYQDFRDSLLVGRRYDLEFYAALNAYSAKGGF